jgi:hypothetical protein
VSQRSRTRTVAAAAGGSNRVPSMWPLRLMGICSKHRYLMAGFPRLSL